MRRLLAIAILVVTGCTAIKATRHPLRGEWTLVASRLTYPDGRVSFFSPPSVNGSKVISDDTVVILTRHANGGVVRSATCRYRVRGFHYYETCPDGTYEFVQRMRGDLWFNTGVHNGMKFEEWWSRAR